MATSNDITLRHNRYTTSVNVATLCTGCDGTVPAPRWEYVAPTPLLVQRGLSAQVLQQELNTIHAKADESVQSAPKYCLKSLVVLLVGIAGFVLMIISYAMVLNDPMSDWTMMFISMPLFLVGVLAATCIFSMGKVKAHSAAMEVSKQYVEVELNEKYQVSHGIRWTMQQESIRSGKQTLTFHHIVVSCVDSPNMQQSQVVQVYNPNAQPVPPQQVVYVDQNGNPVNSQQVQVVVVQQNASAEQNQAAPAYQEASDPPGYTNY